MRYKQISGITITRNELTYIGWGLIGEPQQGVLVQIGNGIIGIDVSGYNEADYWDGEDFKGADCFGIVPVYRTADGSQFPSEAVEYPFNA